MVFTIYSRNVSTAKGVTSTMALPQVAVLGAGVVGCSVAYILSEKLTSRAVVSLIAEKFSPNTTSDKAGALTVPFELHNGGTDIRERRWLEQTMEWLGDVYNSPVGGETGLSLVHGCLSQAGSSDPPWWSDYMLGFQEVGVAEKRLRNIPDEYNHVFSFSSYMVNCRMYLPWLMGRFRVNGGVVMQRTVASLDELSSYSIIVNCTGLGARQLVKDTGVFPCRGDAVIVRAPWIKQFVFLIKKDLYTYVFPRSTSVLLGGTGIDHDWLEESNPSASDDILKRCTALVPSLAHCEVIEKCAGLRPMRAEIRLEAERRGGGAPTIIHCYGHGGKGVTYSWGCAQDVYGIVEECLNTHNHITSNL